ncbi:MAG: FlgD immunoglobulin-like domain containing protein [Elusimicrobia bacterium]|nr:FlgD immunoglobulin-like domain containing protein [Elusimicrobiota bacterium]
MLHSVLLLLALTAPSQAAPSLTKEDGVRLSSAVLSGADDSDITAATRFFYVRASTAVFSAKTADGGQSFTDDPGVRLSTVTEPRVSIGSITAVSVMPLSAGGYRMVYTALSTGPYPSGDFYNVYSATSADGLAWANDTGTRVSGGTGVILGSPSLIDLGSGKWRLYYIRGTSNPADSRIYTALSTNEGRDFGTPSQPQYLSGQAGAVAATERTDGLIRLFYTAPLSGQTTNSTLLSALSSTSDGTVFLLETGTRLSTDAAKGYLSSPFVLRSTDTWRWKLYYNYTPFATGVSTAEVFSASTYAPDPTAMDPNTVLRTAAAVDFTITGDCFSSAVVPTLKLTQGGTVIAPGSVNRDNDQTLRASFTMTGENLGLWDLTVTNDNGFSGTLANALKVDFSAGTVRLTDNLLRPLDGTNTKTRIDVMTYNAGPLSVKLYTLNGELVKTIYDGYAPEGTNSVFWDGKTGGGRTVASGVYFLRTVGQKVSSSAKIVVIK